MNLKTGLTTLGFLFYSASSFASLDVCKLVDKEIANSEVYSSSAIREYKEDLGRECDLAKKYRSMRDKAQTQYGIQLTDISLYQSLRYVERYRYEEAEALEIPVAKIYQRFAADYAKTTEEKSSEVWDNWQVGIKQLAVVRKELEQGRALTINRLFEVHKGFYTLSEETGDYAHVPYPGEMKPAQSNDNPWWSLKDTEGSEVTSQAKALNQNYRSYGLLQDDDENQEESYVNDTITVRPLRGGYSIYSGDSRGNRDHLDQVLGLINQMLKQARTGQHMVSHGRLITPAQLAYLVQQFYVDVHAFYEGNGRTSRFLQELILTSFDMPHGSSGDLMSSDVLTFTDDYYKLAIDKNFAELDQVSTCLDSEYKNILVKSYAKTLRDVEPMALGYTCRLLQ